MQNTPIDEDLFDGCSQGEYATPRQIQELVFEKLKHRKRSCLQCEYFEPLDKVSIDIPDYGKPKGFMTGWCHRFPPTFYEPDSEIGYGLHELVNLSDWCGEFSAIEPSRKMSDISFYPVAQSE